MTARPEGRGLPLGLLAVAVVVIAAAVIARWLGSTSPSTGDEATPSHAFASASVDPGLSTVPTTTVPSSTPVPFDSETANPDATPIVGNGDCGRIIAKVCARAIALARKGHEGEVAGASRIVVDDACRPTAQCDRKYPFDAFVVFVTAGADTTGWYNGEVVGLKDDQPTKVRAWQGTLPAHIVEQLRAPQPSS